MGETWCPMGGQDPACTNDGKDHCSFHLCALIKPIVLKEIREQATAPHVSAIEGWRSELELEKTLRRGVEERNRGLVHDLERAMARTDEEASE